MPKIIQQEVKTYVINVFCCDVEMCGESVVAGSDPVKFEYRCKECGMSFESTYSYPTTKTMVV